tara:strand:- start:754 stop:1038 length:285 start_codon:yes stop_codon:yes gene_type:complete
MTDKIFINGVFLREKTFDNGGSIINIDITDVESFANQLRDNQKNGGKITLEIKERRNKTDNGLTHYMEVSQYVPKETSQSSVNNNIKNNDDLPF